MPNEESRASKPIIWVGQVWHSDAMGSWGDGRDVVVVQINRSNVRVKNLKSGIRTWITRNLFDNPGNFQRSMEREFYSDFDNLDDFFSQLYRYR